MLLKQTDRDKCHFFYSGIHSQWNESPFKFATISFNCAEQFMMFAKALLMNDHQSARQILMTDDPREQKKLGRMVNGYSQRMWDTHRYRVVLLATFLKATQNPQVMADYVTQADLGTTLYVEASPHDRIWGIGVDVLTARQIPVSEWRGMNLLGLAITEISRALVTGSDLDMLHDLGTICETLLSLIVQHETAEGVQYSENYP